VYLLCSINYEIKIFKFLRFSFDSPLYVEISKLPDSKPAYQSPSKIWSKLKGKTDMDDFDN